MTQTRAYTPIHIHAHKRKNNIQITLLKIKFLLNLILFLTKRKGKQRRRRLFTANDVSMKAQGEGRKARQTESRGHHPGEPGSAPGVGNTKHCGILRVSTQDRSITVAYTQGLFSPIFLLEDFFQKKFQQKFSKKIFQKKFQQKIAKQNKTKTPPKYHQVHSVLANCSRHRAHPGVWWIDPVTRHWRKLIFPLPVGISCR